MVTRLQTPRHAAQQCCSGFSLVEVLLAGLVLGGLLLATNRLAMQGMATAGHANQRASLGQEVLNDIESIEAIDTLLNQEPALSAACNHGSDHSGYLLQQVNLQLPPPSHGRWQRQLSSDNPDLLVISYHLPLPGRSAAQHSAAQRNALGGAQSELRHQLWIGAMNTPRAEGFSLLELLVAMAISSLAAMAVIPALQIRHHQQAVDRYSQQLVAGLSQLKATMLSRQDSCIIEFPLGAGTEAEFSPSDLDNLVIEDQDSDAEQANCPRPAAMDGGRSMATTTLRLLPLRNSHSSRDSSDLRILISPASIALSSVGGVIAPSAAYTNEPLILRVRSLRLSNWGRGRERCVVMEASTGQISSGNWQGDSFADGRCQRSS